MASVKELEDRNEQIASELKDLDGQFGGDEFTDVARARWNELNEEMETNDRLIEELNARHERLEQLAGREENNERIEQVRVQTRRAGRRVPDDPSRLEDYRSLSNSIDQLETAYTDGAKEILERNFAPAEPGVDREATQDFVSRLLDGVDHARAEDGSRSLARRIIATSGSAYAKEFETFMKTQGRVVGPEMERAASLTTTAGGYAVPVELDTTLLLVGGGAMNPVRQLARVRTTTVNTVEFLNTTGITASYGDEATEASDNAPTLAQPTVNIEKAQAFVPGSIEIFEDWAAIREDMSMAFRDAKETLENTKFLTGLGHASHEPQGLIAVGGATAVVSTATTAVVAAADLYSLEESLAERYQARASIVGSRAFFNKVRQLDTAGGANLWVQLGADNPPTLLGYPAYRWSSYSSGVTTSGSTVATIGDFNYFAIVDRVGLSVEFIPHLFATGNNRPSGQRGLYMYWRNSSNILSPSLGANSAFKSLKVL